MNIDFGIFPYGTPSINYEEAIDYLNQLDESIFRIKYGYIFDYPDYAGLPGYLINILTSDEVDHIQFSIMNHFGN